LSSQSWNYEKWRSIKEEATNTNEQAAEVRREVSKVYAEAVTAPTKKECLEIDFCLAPARGKTA
jgi:hypothetical protein